MSKSRMSCGPPLLFRELLDLPDGSLVWVKYWDPGESRVSLSAPCTLTKDVYEGETSWLLALNENLAGEFSHSGDLGDPCEDDYEGSRMLLFKIKTIPDKV